MANDGHPTSQYIVINDSDDEQSLSHAGPSIKKGKVKAVQRNAAMTKVGQQSQPISIVDLDSDNGQDAIDVSFGSESKADVVVDAVKGAVRVSNTTVITADQADQALPLLLNILPDLDPEHGLLLLRNKIFDSGQSLSIEHCLQTALECLLTEEGYPKVQKTLKRKRILVSDDEDVFLDAGPPDNALADDEVIDLDDPTCRIFQPGRPAYKLMNFLASERKGVAYNNKALLDLENLFPTMTSAHIRCIFSANNKRFVPTYIALKAETILPDDEKPYVPMKQERARKPLPSAGALTSKKGKKKANTTINGSAGYDAEREWFILHLMHKGDGTSIDHARVLVPTGEGDTECGCCFGDDEQAFMVQCAEGHNFCRECIRRMTETAVGAQTANVSCPYTEGCDAKFHDRDLRKALSVKLYNTYSGIIQRKELEEAGIEGLESCPYCNFMIIVENQEERLFTCQSDDCGIVSCRQCRKHDHLPKTCEEAAMDNVLDKRHAIEEATSEALIRKCPKCSQACIKEAGCNKMTCSSCRTLFCNVCRAVIKGYDHFDQTPANYQAPRQGIMCRLWDPVDKDLYRDEVAAARDAAQQRALEEAGSDVARGDIHVALPEAQPRHPSYPGGHYGYPLQPAALANRAAYLNQAPQVLRNEVNRQREVRNGDANARGRPMPQALVNPHMRLLPLVLRPRGNDAAVLGEEFRNDLPWRGRLPDVVVGAGAAGIQQLRDRVFAMHGQVVAEAGARAIEGVAAAQEGQPAVEEGVVRPDMARDQEQVDKRARDLDGRQQNALPLLAAAAPDLPAFLAAMEAEGPQPEPALELPPHNNAAGCLPAAQYRPLRRLAGAPQPARDVHFAPPGAAMLAVDQDMRVVEAEERARLYARLALRVQHQAPALAAARAAGMAHAAGLEAQALLRLTEAHRAHILVGHLGGRLAQPEQAYQGGDPNFETFEQAKQHLEMAMRAFTREIPTLQQAELLTAARQQAERILPARLADNELALARRVSRRQANEVLVDPISVLLLLHQRHPQWCHEYYEYLIGIQPVGVLLHSSFNRLVAPIIDDLREGRVLHLPMQPRQRTTFHVLRQPHACWNIGAANLVALLQRLIANSGSVFPPERPVARLTIMVQQLLLNSCPEPIMLVHLRMQLGYLTEQRYQYRRRAVAAQVVARAAAPASNNGNRNAIVNRVEVEIAINRRQANAQRGYETEIPDEAPPPYEAIEVPRARGSGLLARAAQPPP